MTIETPDEDEFDRHTDVMAKVTAHGEAHNPRITALACLLRHRPGTNIVAHWQIDRESLIDSAIAMFKRHLEILHWAYAKLEGDPKGTAKLQAMIPLETVDALDAAASDETKLRQDITDELTKFVEFWSATKGKAGDPYGA